MSALLQGDATPVSTPAQAAGDNPLLFGLTLPGWQWGLLLLAIGYGLIFLVTRLVRVMERRQSPLVGALRAVRGLVIPTVILFLLLTNAIGVSSQNVTVHLLETLAIVFGLHVVLGALSAAFFARASQSSWRARVPKLFLDLTRFALVLIGAAFALKYVWGANLADWAVAFGAGSLVIGLALQGPLGNLFAGLALLFERPFAVGEWINIKDITGKVMDQNWRALRLRTRDNSLVIVPNSILSGETIRNYSRPTAVHAENVHVGFSYDDPPNKVKRILQKVALSTRGILADPAPVVRTKAYADFYINYEVKLYLEEYDRLPDILEEFMTQVWYAAKRNRLTIPFPIRQVYKTEMPAASSLSQSLDFKKALSGVPVFVPLDPEEMLAIARDAVVLSFGKGERVVRQGDEGDALYIILEGKAVVSVGDERGTEREVARLSRGEFFGEMALLTGEPRTANVTAIDDLTVIVVYKEALQGLLARRPGLATEIAEIVEARRQGLRAVSELRGLTQEKREQIRDGATQLVNRIKRFLGL